LIGDAEKSAKVEQALRAHRPEDTFEGAELAMLKYAYKLTLKPGEMQQEDVQNLKDFGLDDGQILEVNQIVGYFNYVNRLLNGLGVTTSGDTIGFYK
jgi:uncharacterized peroxidase-related enzyme